jgi:hypothetical protein
MKRKYKIFKLTLSESEHVKSISLLRQYSLNGAITCRNAAKFIDDPEVKKWWRRRMREQALYWSFLKSACAHFANAYMERESNRQV